MARAYEFGEQEAVHFWQQKQRRKYEYLQDLMWEGKGQTEALGKHHYPWY